MSTIIPYMPPLADLPDEVRALRSELERAFVWAYMFNGANGAEAARAAGYSDVAEGAKVRATEVLARQPVLDALAALSARYLFSLAPKALFRLNNLLDDPKHPKHAKAIEMTLDRTGYGARTAVDVRVSGSVTVNHTDAAIEDLRRMRGLGVPREKLLEAFGYSGLPRLERMLDEADRRSGRLIEGEVAKNG